MKPKDLSYILDKKVRGHGVEPTSVLTCVDYVYIHWMKSECKHSLMHKILGVDASKYNSKHLTNPTSAPTLTLQQIL